MLEREQKTESSKFVFAVLTAMVPTLLQAAVVIWWAGNKNAEIENQAQRLSEIERVQQNDAITYEQIALHLQRIDDALHTR